MSEELDELRVTLGDELAQLPGAIASFRDATEPRRAEQALTRQAADLARSNADPRRFVCFASHHLLHTNCSIVTPVAEET